MKLNFKILKPEATSSLDLRSEYPGMGSLDDLRARLAGLSEMLGQRGDTAAVSVTLPAEAPPPPRSARAASPRRRQSQPTVHSASSVLRSANAHARDAPLGGLLAKYRDAEAQWLKVRLGGTGGRQAEGRLPGGACPSTHHGSRKLLSAMLLKLVFLLQEKGKMQLELKAEATRRQKAEGELRRVQVCTARNAPLGIQYRTCAERAVGSAHPHASCSCFCMWVLAKRPFTPASPAVSSLPPPSPGVQDQLAFRLGEVKHLKAALKGRDGLLQDLQDRLRGYEQAEGAERTAAETVRQAQGEGHRRGEMRSQVKGGWLAAVQVS